MIRQSESTPGTSEVKAEEGDKAHAHKDSALWAPTGWVHVEKDIDFSDPKVDIFGLSINTCYIFFENY